MKNLFIFLLGGVVGGLATYYFLDKKMKEEYERKLTDALLEEINKPEDYIRGDEAIDIYDELEDSASIKETKEIDTHKTSYNNVTNLYSKKEEENMPIWADTNNNESVPEYIEPYLITEEEAYANGKYDILQCTYNPDDDTFFDENGESIQDIDFVIGYKNLDEFEKPNVLEIFVCNEFTRKIYDITVGLR